MPSLSILPALSMADLLAVALILGAWAVSGWAIEREDTARPSVSVIMVDYRREWMRQFVTRVPRLFDANVMSSLRQGTSFLASATMLAIGGVLAMIGNRDRLGSVAADLSLGQADPVVWEIKMILVLVFVTNAFLKFVWAHRLFGYCSIVMAAVPNDAADPRAERMAMKAAEINIRAAKGFNRGLRSIYFALGALGWLLGPMGLVAATVLASIVILRREYGSQSREVLIQGLAALEDRPAAAAEPRVAENPHAADAGRD